jgi:hypothetical protein
MMLNFKNVRLVDLEEWDELVSETYGRPYTFQQQDGCKSRGTFEFSVPCDYPKDYENDTVVEKVNGPEEGVSFKAWLARDPKQPLSDDDASYAVNMWWDRNFYPHVSMVIDDLYAKGLIIRGDYLIDIDW